MSVFFFNWNHCDSNSKANQIHCLEHKMRSRSINKKTYFASSCISIGVKYTYYSKTRTDWIDWINYYNRSTTDEFSLRKKMPMKAYHRYWMIVNIFFNVITIAKIEFRSVLIREWENASGCYFLSIIHHIMKCDSFFSFRLYNK